MFGVIQGYINGIMYFLLPVWGLGNGLKPDNRNYYKKVKLFHGQW